MKKLTGLLLAAILLIGVLSGCAETPAENSGTSIPETTPEISDASTPELSESEKTVWPKTYVDAAGIEVVIEKKPERVAVLHFIDMEKLYALGVTPVASALVDRINRMQTLKPLWNADIIDLGNPKTPNLEALVEAEPDLIISYSFNSEMRDELSRIAPVVEISNRLENRLQELGEMLGMEDAAERLVEERSTKLAAGRDQLASLDETVAFLYGYTWNGKTVGLTGRDDSDGTIFYSAESGLGLKAPEKTPDKYEEVSLEGLAELNPDHIFIRGTQEEYEQAIGELSSFSVWNSLSAVKNSQVYWLEESLFTAGPIGVHQFVDYVVKQLSN